jgi:pimeloyl-ACP methyl ester carboxylesterase
MRRDAFLDMLFSAAELDGVDHDQLEREITPLVGRDLSTTPPIMWKQLRALSRHHALPHLARLKGLPTLVLSASDDPIARPAFGRALAEAIPGATFELLSGCSHGVILTQAPVVNARLRQFFASLA